jgi:DNA-binding NtrC family response regulator
MSRDEAWTDADQPEDRTRATVELPRANRPSAWSLELGGREGVSEIVMCVGEELTFGSGRRAAVRIDDPSVSACHCSVRAAPHGLEIRDLGSTNGLYVGGARVASALLDGAGAGFVIGRTMVTIRAADRRPPEEAVEPIPGLVGTSAPMRAVAADVRRHARSRVPVLLQGESGTGKDVIARALHVLSGRQGNYVPLNAGTLPESLADAELFGHRRGAFTGAVGARPGAFQEASGGTLFLDEVAELPLCTQVKLLRVVEDGRVRPLGADKNVDVDVRIVSASWAELPERVREGHFRSDLYHRLSTVVIRVPPLRNRKSDLPALANTLLSRMRDDVGPKELSSAALALLASYAWPGNVRELNAVLYRAAAVADGSAIDAGHIKLPMVTTLACSDSRDALALLARYGGNISAAARAARVPRSTFRSWLDRARQRDARR